jgi:hypothetical protein
VFSSSHIETQLLRSLGDVCGIVVIWLTRHAHRVILLDKNKESVLRIVSFLELLRDLLVCKQQSTGIDEWAEALEWNVIDLEETDSMRNHQMAFEQVQAVSTSEAQIRLTSKTS